MVCRGVFDGVGQKVEQHLFQLVRVVEAVDLLWQEVHAEVDVFLLGQEREVGLPDTAHERGHIAVADFQGKVLLFYLPEVQCLADEFPQPVHIVPHTSCNGTSRRAVLPDFIGQAGQDGERREQFVGHVGEVFQCGARHLFPEQEGVLLPEPLGIEPGQASQQGKGRKYIYKECRPRLVPCRLLDHGVSGGLAGRFPILVGGPDLQGVGAFRQAVVENPVFSLGAYDGGGVQSFQTVGHSQVARLGVVKRREHELYPGGRRRELDVPPVHEAMEFRDGQHAFPTHAQVGERHGMGHRCGCGLAGVDGDEASVSSGVEQPLGTHAGRMVAESLYRGELVGRVMDLPGVVGRIVADYISRGDDPKG